MCIYNISTMRIYNCCSAFEKTMKNILIIITLVLISSCQSENKKDKKLTTESQETISKIPKVNDQFQEFIDQFPEVKLPIKINACEDDFQNLKELDKKISSPYEKESYYIFGKIKTNGTYIATITLAQAECYLPIITTYKLTGEKIDSESLAIGLCGPDPCFECEELMEIDIDLNILVTYNSRYFNCNENGIEIEGIEKKEIIYKKGKLTKNGVIELTNEIKK
jgi:hypothetical protein